MSIELYKGLTFTECVNSFEYTNRLQNNIIEKQKIKIEYLTKEVERLNEQIKSIEEKNLQKLYK